MRVLRVSRKMKLTTLVITTLGITSLAILITGGILGSPLLIGVGVAGLALTCGFCLGVRRPQTLSYA